MNKSVCIAFWVRTGFQLQYRHSYFLIGEVFSTCQALSWTSLWTSDVLASPVWNKAQVTQSGSCKVRDDPRPCQRTTPRTGFNHGEYHHNIIAASHRISIEGKRRKNPWKTTVQCDQAWPASGNISAANVKPRHYHRMANNLGFSEIGQPFQSLPWIQQIFVWRECMEKTKQKQQVSGGNQNHPKPKPQRSVESLSPLNLLPDWSFPPDPGSNACSRLASCQKIHTKSTRWQ